MTASIDRAEVEEALAQWTADGHPRLVRHSEIIAAAARAYLATLPKAPATKLVWKVIENTEPPSSRTFDHIQEALATAGIWLRQSAGDVTISRCSVPA